MYNLYLDTGEIIRTSDNKVIAPCQSFDDPDHLAYIAWINSGNEPDIFNTNPNKPLSEDIIVLAVQNYLDTTAQSKGYDNMLSLTSYATSSVPGFKNEALVGIEFRDNVWGFCYQYLTEVKSGTQSPPTDEVVFISILPKIVWPV